MNITLTLSWVKLFNMFKGTSSCGPAPGPAPVDNFNVNVNWKGTITKYNTNTIFLLFK